MKTDGKSNQKPTGLQSRKSVPKPRKCPIVETDACRYFNAAMIGLNILFEHADEDEKNLECVKRLRRMAELSVQLAGALKAVKLPIEEPDEETDPCHYYNAAITGLQILFEHADEYREDLRFVEQLRRIGELSMQLAGDPTL